MTLTIVKGVAGKGGHELASSKTSSGQGSPTSTGNSAQSGLASLASNSEAAVSNVRSRSGSQGNEKIREFKKAQDLSRDVADRVLEEDSAAYEAHQISDSSARSHLA